VVPIAPITGPPPAIAIAPGWKVNLENVGIFNFPTAIHADEARIRAKDPMVRGAHTFIEGGRNVVEIEGLDWE
jgi:hypothetical protein